MTKKKEYITLRQILLNLYVGKKNTPQSLVAKGHAQGEGKRMSIT